MPYPLWQHQLVCFLSSAKLFGAGADSKGMVIEQQIGRRLQLLMMGTCWVLQEAFPGVPRYGGISVGHTTQYSGSTPGS